ncbi:hypothetical protein CCYA_CCYA14G3694 [Cyanidiococcus yangmingshanensis]|nr:hypothetical protein CCYA_CCYA14G3694 [Cyanidiococcus yangmingshanensis]
MFRSVARAARQRHGDLWLRLWTRKVYTPNTTDARIAGSMRGPRVLRGEVNRESAFRSFQSASERLRLVRVSFGWLSEPRPWLSSEQQKTTPSKPNNDVETVDGESERDSTLPPLPPPPPLSAVPVWRQLKIRWHLLQLERIWPPPVFDLREFLQGAQFAFQQVCNALAQSRIDTLGDAVNEQVTKALRDTLDAYERERLQVAMVVERVTDAQIVNLRVRYDFDRRLFIDVDVELVACFSTTWSRPDGSVLKRELHAWRKPVWRFEALLAERLDVASNWPMGLALPQMRLAPEPEWQLVHILN